VKGKRTAELWLMTWAENQKARDCGGLGHGIGDSGKYRPEDDPHKSSWVQAQIEIVLQQLDALPVRLAFEVYVRGRSVREVGREMGSHQTARTTHNRLLRAVQDRVEYMRELTVSEAAARQAIETGEFDTPGWRAILDYLDARNGFRYRLEE